MEGQDYFFLSPEQFDALMHKGEFLEHATVFGNKYGTLRAPVMAAGHLIVALQSIVSRSVDPLDTAVLSLCTLEGGKAAAKIEPDV